MKVSHLPLAILVVLLACTGLTSAVTDPADTHPDLHLIPWPKSLKREAGNLLLTPESRIVFAPAALKPLAEILAEEITTLTGMTLPVVAGTGRPGDIVLQIDPTLRADEPILSLRNREVARTTDGAHTIQIKEQAVVTGFDYRATAEGSSTLLQLLGKSDKNVHLPHLTIKDWPHADYCGILLDVARQDHPIEAIQKVVRLCRLYKARYLQLHLTDDQGWTFPSTRFPKLGSRNVAAHGGIPPQVYNLDELKTLVAYADARGVTIVPELEMPGHSGAASRSLPDIFDAINPQSRQPVGMGCMNLSNEDLYPALDTIIGEMCDVFRSSPYFHIGSDEVTSGRLSLHPGYKAFLAKHGLKDDHDLADHFVREVCALVKKHGRKAIKWEGMSNFATKDVILMCWEANSTLATEAQARGYTTITCPWNLGVPWEQWNLYVCNASRLKKGDSVLGATLVAWEQPPLTHITNLRNLASRQERTWGPDSSVTVAGFAARFQPLDALAGKLIDLPPRPVAEVTFATTMGTRDFLDPVFAFDGNDATFHQSARPPRKDDSFTMTFPKTRQVHALEILTGSNGRGLLTGGEVQVSSDGTQFTTVATLDKGVAQAILKDNRVQAVSLRAVAEQTEPLVLRAINLRLLIDLAGRVPDPTATIGVGNVAVTRADAELAAPLGTCVFPVINRDFTLKLNSGGQACNFSGPISGTGRVEIRAGRQSVPFVFDGQAANTMTGTWAIKAGAVVLAKTPGVDALAGTILVGGTSDQDALILGGSNQINDAAIVELLGSNRGGASLHLNGFSDTIARLTLAAGCRVQTDGSGGAGILTVDAVTVEGKPLPRGIYTESSGWVQGRGYVIVGAVKRNEVSGAVADPERTLGAGNLAVLQRPATFRLPEGDCSVAVATGDFPLTLTSEGKSSFSGMIAGNGTLHIEAGRERPLVLSGTASNSFRGTTTLVRGVLKLGKSGSAIAIPGPLVIGGSAEENKGDAVVWDTDGQIASSATVTLQGTQPSTLDLNGHQAAFSKLQLSKAGLIRTGTAGKLQLKQLFVDGQRLKDGTYRAPQSWLEGPGTVTVDSRVDVQGTIGAPEVAIGVGNVGNLTGDTKIAYPSSGGDFDILTNGFTLRLDSGDGNAFAYTGSISGTGNVEFYMGPSATGFRDAPLVLAGSKVNTTSGKFLVKKGRVQLEKPEGVVAISGDVVVGGQGFNDCLFWKNSRQLKDTVNITLLDAGNNGAAYLHLNGCQDTATSLTMTTNNRIVTDSPEGKTGVLTVRALTIGGVAKPAGTYTAETEKWIEGKGKVIVRP
jgi:hexosaminidase